MNKGFAALCLQGVGLVQDRRGASLLLERRQPKGPAIRVLPVESGDSRSTVQFLETQRGEQMCQPIEVDAGATPVDVVRRVDRPARALRQVHFPKRPLATDNDGGSVRDVRQVAADDAVRAVHGEVTRFAVLRGEALAVLELTDVAKAHGWPRHVSMSLRSARPCWISVSSFSRSAMISRGGRCSMSSWTSSW